MKSGVIMDVTTPEQAKIAEEAGACAVMALERVPADIRAAGGVARMADPTVILRIMEAVTIPVMAKVRIGHFVEAQILEALGVDYIDESEVLTLADAGNFFLGRARTNAGAGLVSRKHGIAISPQLHHQGGVGGSCYTSCSKVNHWQPAQLGHLPHQLIGSPHIFGRSHQLIPGHILQPANFTHQR